MALAALVSALAAQLFEDSHRDDGVLQITALDQTLHRVEDSAAHAAIMAERDHWWAYLQDPKELFPWCLQQEQDQLLRLLAYCVGQTVDAVRVKGRDADSRLGASDLLAKALGLDMAGWFTPTAENYFGKVSKAQILDALREAKGSIAPAWTEMKKADLAILAERQIAGTGWLPEPLPVPAPALEVAG